MKREPTEEDLAQIARAIAMDDRIEATSMYITITGCGLTEAQIFIREKTLDMQGKEPEKFVRKPKRKNYFGYS
jgi:hypothetical protein